MTLLSGIGLPPLSRVGTVGLSKNRDPVTVGGVRTSQCYCPPPLLHSWFRRLAPYCFQLHGTATPHLLLRPLSPSDRSLGRLPWLRAWWLILWLCRGSMSSASGACRALCTRSRCFSGGPEASTSSPPHTSTWSTRLRTPLRLRLTPRGRATMPRILLSLVRAQVLCLCPAGSWCPCLG